MRCDRPYRILPIPIGQHPPTGDNNHPVSVPDVVNALKASALRLNCIAMLLDLYDKPGALDEAVEILESISEFHN